jgi:hypothetical protein
VAGDLALRAGATDVAQLAAMAAAKVLKWVIYRKYVHREYHDFMSLEIY